MLYRITFLLLTFIATFSVNAQEGDIFGSDAAPTSSFNQQEEEFLRVEQAYEVVPLVYDDVLSFAWSIHSGYYLYQHQFKVEARNDSSSEKLTLDFETGKKKFDEFFNKELVVYYNNTEVKTSLPALKPPYELKISSQGCADAGLCYPPRHQYFTVDANGKVSETATAAYAAGGGSDSSGGNSSAPYADGEAPLLPLVILGALLGGLILNLMPCVFPVLSLKALSFASSNQSTHKQHLHGWAYTAGVVGSFVVAAGIILAARGAGESLGWGFQLQQPGFVAFMAFLFFVMGLSLSGMFHIGTSWMGAGQSLTGGEDLKSSFFTGVLAALVASPCTAPFMATALGFALTQSVFIALLIFIALGFGMALPFLLLSYSPVLAKYLPAPGPWMDTLKQVLAFPLYLTSVWLLWVLANQTSSSGAMVVLAGAVMLAFGIWLLQLPSSNSARARMMAKTFAAASILVAAYSAWIAGDFRERDSGIWQAYSAGKIEELRAEGVPVFVDLTADWCITCKFNERVALNTEKVARFAAINDIVMLQGDWTNSDPEISALLEKFGRSGVPLYLMYPADSNLPAKVLPQILTEQIVLSSMEEALL
ncbi:protein-disulfide reductase DsbD family protein [Agarilytica rhodophyticola]|uniref:protein-disulfide reductase DsbD family protein n=1 Tax=Agarilytica rhodophyticola TaxID=1737490 RepID=UPI000B340EF7|nr:protein-disulfide reductase DsbD [Agarilytica rhodophyticola]